MDLKEFEALKRSSVGHSLIKASRVYNEYAFQNAKKHIGMKNLRPSHLQLFAHIPFEGITIKDLAIKAKITKQAVSALVQDLLKGRVLKKHQNPDDQRSFLVSFNEKSKKGIFEGMKYLKSLDQEIEALLGKTESNELNERLLRIINHYELLTTQKNR